VERLSEGAFVATLALSSATAAILGRAFFD
jgi:hypothetical protein